MTEPASIPTMSDIRATLGSIIQSEQATEMLELAMAVVLDGILQESTEPLWLGLCGPPGCGKTESINACHGPNTRAIDTLASAASFSSGARSKDGGEATSFLREVHGKCLLIKDLTALLSDDPRKARAILGVLTCVFDGEFNKAIGTAFGESAIQSAQSRLAMVFGVTISTWLEHSQTVSSTGARALLYYATAQPAAAAAYARTRDPRKRDHRATLRAQVTACLDRAIEPVAVTIPEPIQGWLQTCAEFIAVGRTPVRSERIVTPDGRLRHDENPAEPEAPFRVATQLWHLVVNLCRLNGRTQPTAHELGLVQRVTLSSVLLARAQIVVPLITQDSFTEAQVAAAAGLSRDTSVYRLSGMELVGLIEQTAPRGPYRIVKRFQAVRSVPEPMWEQRHTDRRRERDVT